MLRLQTLCEAGKYIRRPSVKLRSHREIVTIVNDCTGDEKLRISRPEDPLTESVIGAAMEVHSILGPGFFEGQYEEAFAKELEIRNIPFERQKDIAVTYKEVPIGKYRLDFLVDKRLVVELKAVDSFSTAHTAQVIAYLAATNLKVGLLINFNVASLRIGLKRVLFDK